MSPTRGSSKRTEVIFDSNLLLSRILLPEGRGEEASCSPTRDLSPVIPLHYRIPTSYILRRPDILMGRVAATASRMTAFPIGPFTSILKKSNLTQSTF